MTKPIEIYVDGASRGNPGPAAVGMIIRDAKGKEILKKGEYIGETTNNVAEYEALKRALAWFLKHKPAGNTAVTVRIYTDSELLVNQLTGNYRIKSSNLMPLAIQTKRLLDKFKGIEFKVIKRAENKAADKLANKSMNLLADVDELKITVL